MTGLREVFDRFKPQPKSDGGISKAVGQVINKPDAPRPDNREHDPISGKTTTVARPVEPAPKKSGPISTGHDPDEGTEPWYRRMFAACEPLSEQKTMVKNATATVARGFERYFYVAKQLGFPLESTVPEDFDGTTAEVFAYILGAIHFKEASCNFAGVLHNGEKIIGTGKKTRLVPAGRGPFVTWEEAAIDAIRMNPKRWAGLYTSRDIGKILYALERYNGTGYISGAGKSENSPYLWASSNIGLDNKGKYVADGKFDPNATQLKTVGAAVIIKELFRAGKIELSA